MFYLLVAALMLGAFAIVGWPLLSSAGRVSSIGREVDPRWEELMDQREMAYRAIRDLHFEYQLGNFSREDYERQRALWLADAEAVLGELDRLKKSGQVQ